MDDKNSENINKIDEKAKSQIPRRSVAVAHSTGHVGRKVKKKRGRPSKFKPEYCASLQEFMAKGFTATAWASTINTYRDQIYEWALQFPNFSVALKRGKALRQQYWEGRLMQAGLNGSDNAPVIFALKNCCAEDWREVQRLEHTGKDGGPIETNNAAPQDLLTELTRRGVTVPITHRS